MGSKAKPWCLSQTQPTINGSLKHEENHVLIYLKNLVKSYFKDYFYTVITLTVHVKKHILYNH